MHTESSGQIDHGKPFDWGKTSSDYARFRTGYPDSLYQRLASLGIGVARQKVLDLGTGTGVVARAMARGCRVTGVDISAQQIDAASALAAEQELDIDFRVAPAEETGLPDASFDVIISAQSWLYFERDKTIREVKRLIDPDGLFVTTHACWLPHRDEIAARTESLVLEFNPDWTGANNTGGIPDQPAWSIGHFNVIHRFWYDEPILFNRESWRGRIRACRGVGASLEPERVEAFDRRLACMLEETAPAVFPILHRIDGHLFKPIEE